MHLAVLLLLASLEFGPEQLLLAPRWTMATGRVDFAGVATDGERAMLAWTKFDDGERWLVNYVSFPGRRSVALPTREQATGAVWSGKSFFVITRSEGGGHLIPISADGTPGAPRELGLKMGVFQSAGNGNGFVVVSTEGISSSVRARLFDRDGKLLHDTGTIDESLSAIRTNGRDYVMTRLVIHPDGSHKVLEETPFEGPLGDVRHAPAVRDGKTWLVLTQTGLRRYSADWTLLATTPGDYEWPQAIVVRDHQPPLLVWLTKELALRTSEPALVLERLADETYPRASSDGSSTIVAWRDANGLAATVFANLDEPRRIVDLPGSPRTPKFATISLGGVHYVVWRDLDAVRMMRVSAAGLLLDASPVTIAEAGKPWAMEGLNGPALAANGRGVLAAWVDGDDVRAATIAANGKAGAPFAVLSSADDPNHKPFSLAAAAQGRDFDVCSLEASPYWINDSPQLPYLIRCAAVHDDAAQPARTIVARALYPQRLSLSAERALWTEYQIDFHGPFEPSPPARQPSFLVLRTIARSAAGEPVEIARLPRMTWSNPPAAEVTWLPVDGGVLALWSEPGALMAMPLDDGFQRAGDAQQIGEALNGTLNVVQTNGGALLVYARREGGSARIVVRSAPRRSVRKTPGTSARPDSR